MNARLLQRKVVHIGEMVRLQCPRSMPEPWRLGPVYSATGGLAEFWDTSNSLAYTPLVSRGNARRGGSVVMVLGC